MEVTIFFKEKRTPGDEFLEALRMIQGSEVLKVDGYTANPAVLFRVNEKVTVYPAVTVFSNTIKKEEALKVLKDLNVAPINREVNYSNILSLKSPVQVSKDVIKDFLETQPLFISEIEILVTNELDGSYIYLLYDKNLDEDVKTAFEDKFFKYLVPMCKLRAKKDMRKEVEKIKKEKQSV
ncbi:MAG: hypothetical protein PHE89_06250 [Alphaproteobacteria bacterium]|nr:hypothetical protein [Alphaproteobacteria bacterium]